MIHRIKIIPCTLALLAALNGHWHFGYAQENNPSASIELLDNFEAHFVVATETLDAVETVSTTRDEQQENNFVQMDVALDGVRDGGDGAPIKKWAKIVRRFPVPISAYQDATAIEFQYRYTLKSAQNSRHALVVEISDKDNHYWKNRIDIEVTDEWSPVISLDLSDAGLGGFWSSDAASILKNLKQVNLFIVEEGWGTSQANVAFDNIGLRFGDTGEYVSLDDFESHFVVGLGVDGEQVPTVDAVTTADDGENNYVRMDVNLSKSPGFAKIVRRYPTLKDYRDATSLNLWYKKLSGNVQDIVVEISNDYGQSWKQLVRGLDSEEWALISVPLEGDGIVDEWTSPLNQVSHRVKEVRLFLVGGEKGATSIAVDDIFFGFPAIEPDPGTEEPIEDPEPDQPPTSEPAVSGQDINGSSATNRVGHWTNEATAVQSDGLRGHLEYAFTTEASHMFQIEVVLQSMTLLNQENVVSLLGSIDGQPLGRYNVVPGADDTGSIFMTLPWLFSASHTLKLVWDNVDLYQSLRIEEVRLIAIKSSDVDENGIMDWVDLTLAQQGHVDVAPQNSFVSPVCVEGRSSYFSMMRITAGEIGAEKTVIAHLPGVSDKWYANIPLAEEQTTRVQFRFQEGIKLIQKDIAWTPLNLLTVDDLTLRRGDALRLTAHEPNVISGYTEIYIDGALAYTMDNGRPVVHRFNGAGQTDVRVVHTSKQGTQDRTVVIDVVDAIIRGKIICFSPDSLG